MAEACGEKIITSPPRSRSSRSWWSSMLARISSSPISAGGGSGRPGSARRASCASRNALCAGGAVV